jgi:hypothetical protein
MAHMRGRHATVHLNIDWVLWANRVPSSFLIGKAVPSQPAQLTGSFEGLSS